MNRILVHAPNWVGDHAMAFPFYTALRLLFPTAELTLLGRSWVADLVPDGFAHVITISAKQLGAHDRAWLQSQNFDLGFTLSPSFRSALTLWRLGIHRRYGFATDMRGPLLTRARNKYQRQSYNRSEHRALAYLRLLAPFLTTTDLPEDLFERYRNTQLAALKLTDIEKRLHVPKSAHRVVVCPGSTAASKKYPIEYFIKVIEGIAEQKPSVQFILLGASIDSTECEAILQHFVSQKTKIISLCAKTSLREAHALMQSSRLAIANDSGLAHISSLTVTPLISFNGMGRRQETAPLTRNKVLFDLQLHCSPCFKKECPRLDTPLACLRGIEPASVISAAIEFINQPHRR